VNFDVRGLIQVGRALNALYPASGEGSSLFADGWSAFMISNVWLQLHL